MKPYVYAVGITLGLVLAGIWLAQDESRGLSEAPAKPAPSIPSVSAKVASPSNALETTTLSEADPTCRQSGRAKYCVSSVLEPQQDHAGLTATYGPEQMNDGLLATAWVEGKPGHGEGEWVQVNLGGPRQVSALRIYNGYQKDEDLFWKNARVKDIEIALSNGRNLTATLEDRLGPQTIILKGDNNVEWVRVNIKSIYEGARHEDTAITELKVVSSPR